MAISKKIIINMTNKSRRSRRMGKPWKSEGDITEITDVRLVRLPLTCQDKNGISRDFPLPGEKSLLGTRCSSW